MTLARSRALCPELEPEFALCFEGRAADEIYAGLPVATTALGGALEIINESCGIPVASDDPAALAAALSRLMSGRELRARLGAAGPARAAELCDPGRQLNRLARALDRIAAQRVRRSTPAVCGVYREP